MTECQDVAMREALPELLHGQLAGRAQERVVTHVRECGACSDELELLRAVLAAAMTPAVDVERIAGRIAPYTPPSVGAATAGSPRAGRARAQGWWPRAVPLQLAAAVLLAAAGGAAATFAWRHGDGAVPGVSARAAVFAAPPAGAAGMPPDAGIALIGTADLSDGRLAALITTMDRVDAVPPPEPEPVLAAPVAGGV